MHDTQIDPQLRRQAPTGSPRQYRPGPGTTDPMRNDSPEPDPLTCTNTPQQSSPTPGVESSGMERRTPRHRAAPHRQANASPNASRTPTPSGGLWQRTAERVAGHAIASLILTGAHTAWKVLTE